MDLPTGTVTFLFTDIEGSTKLWEQHPEEMKAALAHHDALLRQAIEQNNGHVFKTVGDAFCAAFHTATEALNAALHAHLLLQAESWDETGPLRVRMALHTGEAEEREGDYFGQPLNRIARLLSTGYGEQTLLSQTTCQLLSDSLPEGCSLQDLGQHRLKDLQDPEHVFQLLHPSLPAAFPPLKSLDYLPTNLPRQLTSFIGREKEMEETKRLLAATPLLTLTGSGGCGKTRLALQVAADLVDRYPDGVWLVELASLSDASLVPQTVASALGLREEVGRPLMETLVDDLQSRTLLLLLDNCEHLVEKCAQLAVTLLKACPNLKILATSQEALQCGSEALYRVPSLTFPAAREKAEAETLTDRYDAIRLFVERAAIQRADFCLTERNALAVVQVCHQLDGIPLALELAAARVRGLTVEQIAKRLDDRFGLLTRGSRTAPSRQQTLKATIDWSYALLSEQERLLLGRASVFAGGWSLEAAEQVCAGAGIEAGDVLDLLASLVDKSLVVFEEWEGEGRYRLLETIREYGRERLGQTEEGAVLRGRHLALFLALAEEAEPQLMGPQQAAWLNRLETEHDNLRAALKYSAEYKVLSAELGDASLSTPDEAGLRLAGALSRFWMLHGHLSEARGWLQDALERSGDAPTVSRAKALTGLGTMASNQGDYRQARSLYESSLAILRDLGDERSTAATITNLGTLAWRQGDYRQARSLYEESLAMRRALGDRWGIAASLNNLGTIAQHEGDEAAARTLHAESLSLRRQIGDREGVATSLNNLGSIAKSQGDYATAQSLYEESLAVSRELGDQLSICFALNNLGEVAYRESDFTTARSLYESSLAISRALGDERSAAATITNLGMMAHDQGDHASARALFEESLSLRKQIGDKEGIAYSLEAFAGLAASESKVMSRRSDSATARLAKRDSRSATPHSGETAGRMETVSRPRIVRAAQLWGTAEALREAIGAPLPPNEREPYDRVIAEAREALGAEAFAEAQARGRTMTMEQAVAYAGEVEG